LIFLGNEALPRSQAAGRAIAGLQPGRGDAKTEGGYQHDHPVPALMIHRFLSGLAGSGCLIPHSHFFFAFYCKNTTFATHFTFLKTNKKQGNEQL